MAAYPNFLGPAYESQSVNATAERLINLVVERLESPGAKAQYALFPIPGIDPAWSLPDGNIRGMFALDGRLWAISGEVLHEVFADGTFTSRGSVGDDGNPATFASNGDAGTQLLIASGNNAHLLDLTTHAFTGSVKTGIVQVGYLDGFFLGLDRATSSLFISDLLDGSTWDPTQFAQRLTAPDPWTALIVAHREIWLFGTETSEVWGNVGTSPFPFERISGLIPIGIAAPYSVEILANTPVWLGQSADGAGVVYRANGYQPERISNHAVEYAIQTYLRDDGIDDAIAFTYQDQGHDFYVLTFPAAGATWAFDASTGMWSERAWYSASDLAFLEYRPRYHAFCFDKQLVGDRASGVIYHLSNAYSTDADGTPIRRVRRAPHLVNDMKRLFYHELTLDLETGLGLSSGAGSDPQVMLRYSNDGGKTWGNERWTSAGAIGNYKALVKWTRLGASRNRVFEVTMADAIPWRIAGAYLDATAGSS